MKRIRYPLLPILLPLFLFLCLPAATMAQGLTVETGVICTSVEERAPVDADTTFSVTDETLCCFTKITGAEDETTISHVWYWGDVERARVELTIRGISWRTYTSKRIQEHEVGAWRVDILDAEGTVLKSVRFTVTP